MWWMSVIWNKYNPTFFVYFSWDFVYQLGNGYYELRWIWMKWLLRNYYVFWVISVLKECKHDFLLKKLLWFDMFAYGGMRRY